MTMNCQIFKRSLYHYQADELPHEERLACEEHVGRCAPCAALLEVEDGLLRGLKARLEPVAAPPGLETRILAGLRESSAARPRGFGWLRTPWFAALAASILLAVLLVPSDGLLQTASAERVSTVVTLVDRACDLAGKSADQQRSCEHPRHLNALRLDDGSYWDVSLDRDEMRAMITDRDRRGTRMQVEGWFFKRIRTLQVESVRALGPESARAALSPH